MNLPVIDLHCDLLSYLDKAPGASPFKKEDIGCSVPALEAGNVKLQVMAIYTAAEKGSSQKGLSQSRIFDRLLHDHVDRLKRINNTDDLSKIAGMPEVGIVAAIENASGFCEEDESLDSGFRKLEQIITNTGRILYIGFTHHGEDRFGGGNATNLGLKEDGKILLKYMSGRKIALDLAHTSDRLAYDMLDYITGRGLDIPIIASHSNFRQIWDHPRNLPDDIVAEIIRRKGLIGINFLRAFLNNDDPGAIYDHLNCGIAIGAEDLLCFGADYFYTAHHPDPSRVPFFFKEHASADCYPSILEGLSGKVAPGVPEKIAYKNAIGFMERFWS